MMFQVEAMFDKYGIWDYVDWDIWMGFPLRSRAYHDGAWLEGYDLEPVVYWGA